ncbi:YALIA101S02e12772g1_1 [Yarrowia lipolytica]|jgi:serine/threonine protein kinase|nr:Serine/threonine-protein kinase KSP1 [Yarrowia lipolytica]SEI32238.1 YALIA101S02e12772g1_1 [Yarrowia lipolytica]
MDTSSYTEYDAGKLLNNRYRKVADLNKGSYGQVSLATDTHTDELVAIKCLVNSPDPTAARPNASRAYCSRAEIDQEIAIHSALKGHKNVAQLLDHFTLGNVNYLVVEYCAQGDLYEAISGGRGPKESGCTREFMLQLVDALIFCHSRGVYHRDIKPENILISKAGTVKLADWGLATFELQARDFGVGSERYMAPELFDGASLADYNTQQADIWSVGICLLNILFGRNPFTKASSKDKLFMDFAANREALFDIFPAMTPDTFAVLRHSLTIDPANRSLEEMRSAILLANAWTTDEEFEEFAAVDDMSCSVPYYDSGFGETLSDKRDRDQNVVSSVPSHQFVHFQDSFDNDGDVTPTPDNTDVGNAGTPAIAISLASPVLLEEDVVTTCSSRLPLRTPTVLSPKQHLVSQSPWDRTMQFTPPAHRFSLSSYKPRKKDNTNGGVSHARHSRLNPRKWTATSAHSMESLSEESDPESLGDEDMFRMDDEVVPDKQLKKPFKTSIKTPRNNGFAHPKLSRSPPDSDLDVPSLSNTSSDSSKASVYVPPSRRRNHENKGALSSSAKKAGGLSSGVSPAKKSSNLSSSHNFKPEGVYRPPFLRKSQATSVPSAPLAVPKSKASVSLDFASSFNLGKSWSDLVSDEEDDWNNGYARDEEDHVNDLTDYMGSVSINNKSKTDPMKIPFRENWQNWVA